MSYADSTTALSLVYIIALIIGVVLDLGLAIIPAVIASKKGLSGVGFYFFGVGCLPAAIIVACVLKSRKKVPDDTTGNDQHVQ